MTTRDILFEIGTEELPSAPLNKALAQLEVMVEQRFAQERISYSAAHIYASPRRIALFIEGVSEFQDDSVVESKGPAKNVAFDAEGNPTPAAQGFARSKGVAIGELETRDIDGVEYLFAVVEHKGIATASVLPRLLEGFIKDLEWKRSQRWGSGDERFARPVRWLVALFGDEIIPVKFGHLQAGRVSQGHRFLENADVVITSPRAYASALKDARVIVEPSERKELILEQTKAVAAPFGEPIINEDVLEEVVNLTEYPVALAGTFDESYLRVPREILESAMSKHQRYFAIQRADGTLDNHFVVISNGDPSYNGQILEGHERVIRARLSDAAFFFDEDRKVSLDDWASKLSEVVFQEKLGTVADKVERIERLAVWAARSCELGEADVAEVSRASRLCKADLVTNAVVEFTEVQGVMGGHYAELQGESVTVARAIAQHYQPRFAGDAIPDSKVGQLVALADKLDTIAGIFAIGKAPKGTSDPFALRRSAIGVLNIMLQSLNLNLDAAIDAALEGYQHLTFNDAAVHQQVADFFRARLTSMLKDEGVASEVINAVYAATSSYPCDIVARSKALQAFLESGEEITSLSAAFKRAKNLSDPAVGETIDESLLSDVERDFSVELNAAQTDISAAIESGSYERALQLYAGLKAVVDEFFDKTMIMDEDPALRRNRLALLNIFLSLFARFADFSELA